MNKKLTITTFSLFLLSILSFSAFAQIQTPSTFLSGLVDFFRGIFTGGFNIESAYFVTFILYFVIFLALYMEGLTRLPIFGAGGSIDKNGKVFAFAASALSTIAIFFVEQASGISSTERLNGLLAPWGVWGGVAIAAIVAYITYKLIRDSDVFGEEVLFAMAAAAGVGVTFAGFLLTIELLIGWGFLIMLLVFVVGGIREYIKKREDTAPEREVEEKKIAKSNVKINEKSARERKLRTVTSPLIKLIGDVTDLNTSIKQTNKSRANANAQINMRHLLANLIKVNHNLKTIARRERDAKVSNFLNKLHDFSGVALLRARNITIPAVASTDWDADVNSVVDESKKVKLTVALDISE